MIGFFRVTCLGAQQADYFRLMFPDSVFHPIAYRLPGLVAKLTTLNPQGDPQGFSRAKQGGYSLHSAPSSVNSGTGVKSGSPVR